MHRNQFNNKYANFKIGETEMERKWRIYEEEKKLLEEMEALMLRDRASHITAMKSLDPSINSYVDDGYIDDYFV
jgi:hypothetical protein